VDGRTDQYALACVVFFLLTGMLPFDRGQLMSTLFAQMFDPVPQATKLRAELPAAVDDVLARALAKSPADRYASCAEFAEALREALLPARPTSPVVPQRRKPQDRSPQTDELPGLIDANRRLLGPEQTPEELSRLIDANRRLLAEKGSSGSGPQPGKQGPAGKQAEGRQPQGKHASGKQPEDKQPAPEGQQADGDPVLFSLVLPQQPLSSLSDGVSVPAENAADESPKASETPPVDKNGKTHPGQGTDPDDPDGQHKRWRRWTTFLPGPPR